MTPKDDRIKMMVVDDSQDHLELIRAALASEDIEVLTAASAESALEQFEKTRTRIVLSDLFLPGMSGMELLERMVAAGWVGRVHVGEQVPLRWGKGARAGTDCWVLLVDPRLVKLADVYRLFVFGGIGSEAGPPADGAQSPLALDTAALARQVEASVERGLDETLAEHFENVRVGEVTS